jgi:hypothetical protein
MMNSFYGQTTDTNLVVCAEIGGLLLRAGPYDPVSGAKIDSQVSGAVRKDLSSICTM